MPLLFVLWSLGLLAIIAAAAQSSGTLSYALARNAAELASREAQVEAALNLAVLALLDGRASARSIGRSQMILYDGANIEIEIQDQLGLIDLNHADGPLLAKLFRAAGLPPQEASKIADRILDWRDPDDLRRLNGAEAREYREAAAPYLPRNESFQSKDELRLVLGVTPELFRKVEPAITIHSGKPGIDPRVAPPLVRRAHLGESHAVVSDPGPVAAARAFTSLAGRAFAICITLPKREDVFTRKAVIRLTGDPFKPYWLLEQSGKGCDAR
jgi:general secretion pathway protein K